MSIEQAHAAHAEMTRRYNDPKLWGSVRFLATCLMNVVDGLTNFDAVMVAHEWKTSQRLLEATVLEGGTQ